MMQRVFVKILLWFWVSLALVGLALQFAVLATTTPIEERLHRFGDQALTAYARTAAETFEGGGRPALAAYFDRLERTARIRAALFDDAGRDVSGRATGPDAAALARLQRERRTMEPQMAGAMLLKARAVAGPRGGEYVLVAATPIGFLRLLYDAPSAQLLRLSAVLLTAAAVCFALARYVAKPLATLRAATREVAAGNLTVRVGPAMGSRKDEFGDLGRDFDRMAERIEALMTGERRLLRDISHELRSPLARLNVALGLVRQRERSEDPTALDRIEREAERLNSLIEQLLTLARLESGTDEPGREPVDLTRLVHEVADDADFEAAGRQRSVHIVESNDCTVVGEPELLRSAVENVVRNAVRHTRPQTAVEIAVRRHASPGAPQAVIAVRDYGPGVPENTLEDIFRPFYRVGDARERESGGVGLGLTIAHRTIRLHGGTVRAANAAGGGLSVEIRVPTADGGAAPGYLAPRAETAPPTHRPPRFSALLRPFTGLAK
jgi:two-component system sensor histidine kinase CpxA